MTCLRLVIISWASFFSKFSRDREAFSRLLLADWNVESTGMEGGVLRGFVKEEGVLVYLQLVVFYSERGKGYLQGGGVFIVDVFIEPNLSFSLSISPRSIFLPTTGVGNWVVGPRRVSFPMIS